MERVFILNKERNVTLTALVQPVYAEVGYIKKRPSVIVLPGGAYKYCSDREAEPIAYAYMRAGFNAFVLRYSVGDNFKWPYPLDDYEQAAEFVKEHADEWNIDTERIAVIGFSAGGHLASMAATIAKNKPSAAILCYPATKSSFWKPFVDLPDGPESVDFDTCPCFLFATRDDRVVSVDNSIDFENALTKYGIQFESHVYSHGPHGLSTGDSSMILQDDSFTPRALRWVDDSISWLKEVMGDFGANGMTSPLFAARVNADAGKFLSMQCSVKLLKKATEYSTVVKDLFAEVTDLVEKNINKSGVKFTAEEFLFLYRGEKMDKFCLFVGMDEAKIKEYDTELRKIKNTVFL